MLINTIYVQPTPEQLEEAKNENKVYKVVYHNGKISHWQLQKIQEPKTSCSWCGKKMGTNI